MNNLVICQNNDNRLITDTKFTYECYENTDNTLVCNSETIILTTIPTTIPTKIPTTEYDESNESQTEPS